METLLETQNETCPRGREPGSGPRSPLFRPSCIASSAQGTPAALALVLKCVIHIIGLVKLNVSSLLFKHPTQKVVKE